MIAGIAVLATGYATRDTLSAGARPYTYVAVMAIGAMVVIIGALIRRDS
jgi:hypothetical protein